MAVPDVFIAAALHNKCQDLRKAGHFARADEYRERALVAVQALGITDCLIVAQLQLHRAGFILDEAVNRTSDGQQRAVRQATALEHFMAAAAAVQRRRLAGTLMPGCCSAAEVTWLRLVTAHVQASKGNAVNAEEVAEVAQMVGHEAFVQVATFALVIISRAFNRELAATPQHMRTCWDLLADTANLMVMPRGPQRITLAIEGAFLQSMRWLLSEPALWVPMDTARERVLEAWRALERSGVLREQQFEHAVENTTRAINDISNAAAAAAAAPGLRSCALASCGAREAHPSHFKSCAACRIPVYCCKEHQTEDWPSHKAACKAARKGKAAAE